VKRGITGFITRRLKLKVSEQKSAIAHRLCRLIWKVFHEGVRYLEKGSAVTALTLKRRKQRLVT
jgi:hypothetical protein